MTIRYFDACPHWRTLLERVTAVASDLGHGSLGASLELVESDEDAERLRFVGSPTMLLNGRDPFEGEATGGYGLSCRIYGTPEGPAGSPTKEQLREVLAPYFAGDATS